MVAAIAVSYPFRAVPRPRSWAPVLGGEVDHGDDGIEGKRPVDVGEAVLGPHLRVEAGRIDRQDDNVAATSVDELGGGANLRGEGAVDEALLVERDAERRALVRSACFDGRLPLAPDGEVVNRLHRRGRTYEGSTRSATRSHYESAYQRANSAGVQPSDMAAWNVAGPVSLHFVDPDGVHLEVNLFRARGPRTGPRP